MYKIIALLIWGILLGNAHARFGETPEQCIERYGVAVTNLPGYADVERVAIHKKDELTITVVFFRGKDNQITAVLIHYTRAKPLLRYHSFAPDITQEDVDAILGTVEGQWTLDKPAIQLAGPKPFSSNIYSASRFRPDSTIPTKTPITNGSSITSGMSDKVAQSVQGVLSMIYPNEITYTTTPISHNGPRLFSFRVLHGVAICSADKISSINQWANYTRQQSVKPTPKPILGL